MIAVIFASILVFIFVGVPIAFAMGIASLFLVLFRDNISPLMMSQRAFTSLDNWLVMAIPLFMLAGKIMTKGGMSRRIVDFSSELFGFVRGGLAIISVMASMIFAGVSGSSTADTAAIGSIMLPAMKEKGYNMNFATALQAAAGSIGPVIPPSILMILIGYTTDTSIAQLFLGGIIPGILIAVHAMITSYIHAIFGGDNYLPTNKFSMNRLISTGIYALPGIGLPFIIIFGIVGGVFTATEAAVIAVVYGLFVGMFIYKDIKIKDIPQLLLESAEISTIVLFCALAGYFFARLVILEQVPTLLLQFIHTYVDSQAVFLIFVNILFLILGMFIGTFSAVIIFMPIVFPIAMSYAIDPVHFGVLITVNLAIGYITPPYGADLFVACSISGQSIRQVTPHVLPFVIAIGLVLIIVTYFPGSFMWIPELVRG